MAITLLLHVNNIAAELRKYAAILDPSGRYKISA